MTNPGAELSALEIYWPAWLLRVPGDLLSSNAKLVYGNLFRWDQSGTKADRGLKQIGLELGINLRTARRVMRELKKVGLIETTKRFTGYNDIEFLDHEWMDVSLAGQELNCPEYTETDVSPRENGELYL